MKDTITINEKEMPRILRVMQATRGVMTARQLAAAMGLSGPDDKIEGCRLRHIMARIAKLGGYDSQNSKQVGRGAGRPEVEYWVNAYGEAMIHSLREKLTGPAAVTMAPIVRREDPVPAPTPSKTTTVAPVSTSTGLKPLKSFAGTPAEDRGRAPAVIPAPTKEAAVMPPPPMAKKSEPKPKPAAAAPTPKVVNAPKPAPEPKPATITDIQTRIARPPVAAPTPEALVVTAEEVVEAVRALSESVRITALEEMVAKLETELSATRREMTSMRAAFLGIAQAINHGLKGASNGRDT